MTTHWAIDVGMSNTTVCEDRSGRPHIVNIPDLAKLEPVTQTPVMPSCVCVMNEDGTDALIRPRSRHLQLGRTGNGLREELQAIPGDEEPENRRPRGGTPNDCPTAQESHVWQRMWARVTGRTVELTVRTRGRYPSRRRTSDHLDAPTRALKSLAGLPRLVVSERALHPPLRVAAPRLRH
jgi:hypothetical protein